MSYTMAYSSTYSSVALEEVNEEKDLGVWCTNNFKTIIALSESCSEGYSGLGLIRRLSQSIQLYSRTRLCATPLEYCVQVWNPYLAKDIDMHT